MPRPDDGGAYLEFVVQGRAVRVTAIDPRTGAEAVVMGPAGASRAALTDAALRKLEYVVRKRSGG